MLSDKYKSEAIKLTKNLLDFIDILYDLHPTKGTIKLYPHKKLEGEYKIQSFNGHSVEIYQKNESYTEDVHVTKLSILELIALSEALEKKEYEK